MNSYTLFVDGGGNAKVLTYFSYLCPETKQRVKLGKFYQYYNPIKMERYLLKNLTPNLLPEACGILDAKGNQTNNMAEYAALYYGLKRFSQCFGEQQLIVHQDSKLIINQVLGWYQCKANHLRPWLNGVKSVIWPEVSIVWVSRDKIVEVLGH